ncbi:MAG: oxidoreductase, partial [Nocardia sp.]|nr:oxidoreductase [Nocardia sp.]
DDWFATDWMDTTRSQEVLGFQHHSWPDLLAQIRSRTGVLRYLVRPAAPLVRLYLKKMSPYKDSGRTVADPWTVIAERIGDPTPDKA